MLLSICLPTYNRPEKAFNLILGIDAYIKTHDLNKMVEFIVSDNSDSSKLEEEITKNFSLGVKYHKQNQNIGYDNNILYLKEIASGDYIFYVSDDDSINYDIFENLLNGIKKDNPDIFILNWGYYDNNILFNVNKNMGLIKNHYILKDIINYPIFYFLPSFCFKNIKTDFKPLLNTVGVQMEIIYNSFNPNSTVTVLQEINIIRNDQVEVGTGCTVVQDWVAPLGFLRIKNKYRAKFNFKTPILNTIKFSTKLVLLKLFSKNYNHVNLNLLRKNLTIAIKELM
jgi:glycosyltransferase involved in cell wall biosynthesis